MWYHTLTPSQQTGEFPSALRIPPRFVVAVVHAMLGYIDAALRKISIVLYVERMHYLTFVKSRFCTLLKNFVKNSLGHMAYMF